MMNSVKKILHNLKKYHQLYILLLPGVLHYIIFRYLPMTGIVMAFQDFDIFGGILNSPWVGLKHFRKIFSSTEIFSLIRNTILLGTYSMLWGTFCSVTFAVFLNEVRNTHFKKLVQSISFFPSLLSVVVVCSMIVDFLSPTTGMLNTLLASFGFEKHYFMIDPKWYRTIYISSGVWQGFGYSAIVYFAAISSIDSSLYESAELDGCSRLKKIWYITLPSILPTICTMTILNAGSIFRVGADKTLLLYNPMTYETADVFGSYVYRKGILEGSFSLASAAGLFEALVAFAVVCVTNSISKRVTENSLW